MSASENFHITKKDKEIAFIENYFHVQNFQKRPPADYFERKSSLKVLEPKRIQGEVTIYMLDVINTGKLDINNILLDISYPYENYWLNHQLINLSDNKTEKTLEIKEQQKGWETRNTFKTEQLVFDSLKNDYLRIYISFAGIIKEGKISVRISDNQEKVGYGYMTDFQLYPMILKFSKENSKQYYKRTNVFLGRVGLIYKIKNFFQKK